MQHNLKIRTKYFEAVNAGLKLAELRLNDRDYKVSDILKLEEWNILDGYTGNYCLREVIHITDLEEFAPNWVLLSLKEVEDGE